MLCAVCCAVRAVLSGEEPHSGIVASISSDNPALVTCVDDERLEFQVCAVTAVGLSDSPSALIAVIVQQIH
jgi:hypothetical protein